MRVELTLNSANSTGAATEAQFALATPKIEHYGSEGSLLKIHRAVLLMFMPAEEKATIAAIRSVLAQLTSTDRIVLLCNGGLGNALVEQMRGHALVSCYEVRDNLGVAGGRNYLFQTTEAQEADLIYVIDNDLVVPSDYLDVMERFLAAQSGVAIAGPVILNFGYLAARHPILNGFVNSTSPTAPSPVVTNAGLRDWALATRDAAAIYHLGTNTHWRSTYFDDAQTVDGIVSASSGLLQGDFKQSNSRNPRILNLLFDGQSELIETTNVGGGALIIRRSLLDEIGLLSDLFSPYGYEDVDFSLRAIHAGYRNVIDARTFILHGTDDRHSVRATSAQIGKRYTNASRALTLLEAFWMPDQFPIIAFRRLSRNAMARSLRRLRVPQNREILCLELEGVQCALEQIKSTPCKLQPFRQVTRKNPDGAELAVGKRTIQAGDSSRDQVVLRAEILAKINAGAESILKEFTEVGLESEFTGTLEAFDKKTQKKCEQFKRTQRKEPLVNLVRARVHMISRVPVIGQPFVGALAWIWRRFLA